MRDGFILASIFFSLGPVFVRFLMRLKALGNGEENSFAVSCERLHVMEIRNSGPRKSGSRKMRSILLGIRDYGKVCLLEWVNFSCFSSRGG